MRILIIGAGFVGLSMARRLESCGAQLRIMEKEAAGRQVEGAGICLPASAMARMQDLGLKEAVLRRAFQVQAVRFFTAAGALLSEASLLEPPLNSQPFVALPRAELIALLLEGQKQPVEYGSWVARLEDRGEKVWVRDNHGREEEYDLVIGADGIFSATRKLIFPDWSLIDFGLTTWRFILQRPQHGLQPTYIVGADDLFMFYPISVDSLYCYAHAQAQPGDERAPKARLGRQFAHYSEQVRQAIEATSEEQIIVGRILAVEPPCRIYRGRVVLMGDAMHGCPPSMQAGLDLGLEDVLTLGHCLEQHAVPAALELFARERVEHASWVVSHSNKMIRLARLGRWGVLGRLLRNAVVRRTGPPNALAWRKVVERGFRLPS